MLNKVMLIGRLGRDVETKYLSDGKQVSTFSIATTEKYKDKETTEWHRIVAFGRLAEIAAQYLSKGSLVYIEGGLRTRSWEGKDGQKKYSTEIICRTMKMLGPKGGQSEVGGDFEGDAGGEEVPF